MNRAAKGNRSGYVGEEAFKRYLLNGGGRGGEMRRRKEKKQKLERHTIVGYAASQ